MFTASARLTFYIAMAHSLKDKRQVRRSLIDQVRHRFNVAIAEVDTQDVYQTLTIGIAVVSGTAVQAEHALDTIIRYMEDRDGAELIDIERLD